MVLSYESGILLFNDSYSGSFNYGFKGKSPQDPIKMASSFFALYQLSTVASRNQYLEEEEYASHRLWLEKVFNRHIFNTVGQFHNG
jgi:hypothetical protein